MSKPLYLLTRTAWNNARHLLAPVDAASKFTNTRGYCLARPEWDSTENKREWLRFTGATQVSLSDLSPEDARQAAQMNLWAFDMD
jgi:hypothetical protein